MDTTHPTGLKLTVLVVEVASWLLAPTVLIAALGLC